MTHLALDRVVKDTPGWYEGDFHCHTTHSDGRLSPAALLDAARREGLDFFAITDHNTTGAYGEFGDPADMAIIPGLEVTFDQGHFNVFGIEDALPWAEPFCPGPTEIELAATAYRLHALVRDAATAGLVTSLNHPLLPPWAWADPLTDLADFHCVEIWNDPTWPDNHVANPAAVELWTQWLNAGYRITAIGGSDFHRDVPPSPRKQEHLGRPRTIVYAEHLSGRAILHGVRRGRAYMTMGPRVTLSGRCNGAAAGMGDNLGPVAGELEVAATVSEGYHGPARILCNGAVVAETRLDGAPAALACTLSLTPDTPAWVRLDVHGRCAEQPDELLWAVTNPIFAGPVVEPALRRYGDFVETPVIRRRADRLQWPVVKSIPGATRE